MAITTLDGALAGTQDPWPIIKNSPTVAIGGGVGTSLWAIAGVPGPGSYNSTLNGGTYTSTGGLVAGQIPHFDPGSGNSYLYRFAASSALSGGWAMLHDRLWDNGGISITSTASQAIVSGNFPARDVFGLNHGIGVMLAVEVSAACASTTTLTLGYTNSVGTAGRTTSLASARWSATATGNFAVFPLAAGDQGVQSVQSIQLTASMTSGTINLVAIRPIVGVDVLGNTNGYWVSKAVDPIKGCFQQLYNGTVPFIVFTAQLAAGVILNATYQETQG